MGRQSCTRSAYRRLDEMCNLQKGLFSYYRNVSIDITTSMFIHNLRDMFLLFVVVPHLILSNKLFAFCSINKIRINAVLLLT